MRTARMAAGFLLGVVTVGCAPQSDPGPPATSPSPSPVASSSAPVAWPSEECRAAASSVGTELQVVVSSYEQPVPADPSADDGDLDGALAEVQEAVADGGCDPTLMQDWVQDGVDAVEAESPLAEAVRARLVAGLEGRIPAEAGHIPVSPGEDLVAVVAQAPAGATLQLASGSFELTSPLVLLGGITIAGAGADATVLRSNAEDSAVLVATSETVVLEGLSIIRDEAVPGSGVVAGGSAALVLQDVAISGARSGEAGGGAAVMLVGDQAGERRTTAEITGSTFSGSEWAGLAVSGSHRVSVEMSTFEGNGECGVCFLGTSNGSVSASSVVNNPVGFAVTETAAPTLLDNTVTGGEVGFQVQGESAPVAEGNSVSGSKRAAVIVSDSAAGAFAGTTCSDVEFGIVVTDTAAPTLTDNDCELARGRTEE